MKKILCLTFLLYAMMALGQDQIRISGTISDGSSNESLIGVSVYFPKLATGTTTNAYGFYSISIPKGTHTMVVQYLGFASYTKEINLTQDQKMNIALQPESQNLEEVVVTKNKTITGIKNTQMSVNMLNPNTLSKIPVVLGEADILKTLTLLPGVTSGGEGASGFNVRGGAADQNLILLDEATIFNSSHLFGFFSVFNPDAIKSIKLYKGGIPAKFGGRTSSVLEMYQKEGNSKKLAIKGGVSVIASKLLVEGPIKKDKGSFLIGARSSYAHLFLKLNKDNNNSAYFYDLNTKLSYRLSEKNKIFASGYFGRDVFSINNTFENSYGNTIANLRWNHIFSDKLFSNLSLIYSDYYYGLELDFVGFKWNSGIQNTNIKYDIKQYIGENTKLNYGLQNIYYVFNPGEIKPNRPSSGINYDKLNNKYANTFAAYIDADQKISDKIQLRYGLRASMFHRLGQKGVHRYTDNNPVIFNSEFQIYEKATPTSTYDVSRSKSMKSYINLEPRFAISYSMDENTSIKASYNRMTQYLHLISNTNSPTPLDVWAPSGEYIKPQLLDQVALGYFKNIGNTYRLESEVFYKKGKNRLDYINGADLIANKAIEQVLLTGETRAYGAEFLLRKNTGKLTGWISYTLSKSQQRTPGRNAQETGINNANWYYNAYDKTHDVSITTNYALNTKWNIGANLIVQSGQPVTYPVGQYQYQGVAVPVYGQRNTYRLPAYHRLDVSASYTPKKNKTRRWQSEWVFSVYNLYNRKNAASISFRENEDTGVNEAVRLSIFGIIPSVSYNFKF